MFRRPKLFALAAVWAAFLGLAPGSVVWAAQENKEEKKVEQKNNQKKDAGLTAENVAEYVILIFGSRPIIQHIRRTGVERGRVTRSAVEGPDVEISYERFFKRGETTEKDKVRLDQKRANPNLEYSILYDDGRVWGIIKGTTFTPRQEELTDFDSSRLRGIENLLRYKEDGATLHLVGKEKQKNIDLFVLDLTDKQNRRTRYFISEQTGKVLWLEYEETPQGGGAPVKYRKTFHDYRIVQSTRLPYRTVLYANDKKLQETQVMTVTYGLKMEDAVFKNEEPTSGDY